MGLCAALLAACAAGARAPRTGQPLPAPALTAADTASALRLVGEVSGPLLGFGRGVRLTAWVRADGWLRADLSYEVEGRRAEDVLVWTPDAAFLTDRRTGRLTMLGDEPGAVEADGGAFRVEHALWLALGRRVGAAVPACDWVPRRGEWRGRMGNVAARGRPRRRGGDLAWTELAWRMPDGAIRSLTAELRRPVPTPWGRVPGEVSLDGSGLPGRAVLRWDVEAIPAPGDSLFDPLWRP